jgi:hypothetical protein
MDHDDRVALPRASSTPPARGVSSGERPPRLNLPTLEKTRRRPFVVPSHVHLPPPIPGQDSPDVALAAGGVLPPRYSHGSVSATTKARSCSRVEDHTECQDPTGIKNVITKNRSKHRRLLWEQEQKIMFCDVSKLDDAQRTYVLVMRSQIAKEKASLLSSSRGSSAGDGDGESCA